MPEYESGNDLPYKLFEREEAIEEQHVANDILNKVEASGSILANMSLTNDTIFFGSNDCHLYAVSLDGRLRWKFQAGDMILAQPIVSNGVVYFGSFDKRFYAVKDGTKQWSVLTGGSVCTPIAVDSKGDEVYGLRTRGEKSYRTDMENGVLCVGSYDNYFYFISMNGDVISKFRVNSGFSLNRPPCVTKGIVYFGSYDNYLYALSVSDSKELWKFKTGSDVSTTPCVHNDGIFFGSQDGYLYSLNMKGDMMWQFKTNGPITTAPLIDNDMLYIASWDNCLYAISLAGSRPSVIWEFRSGYGKQSSTRFTKEIHRMSMISRIVHRIWKSETKASIYDKDIPQQNFTFGLGYRASEPYKTEAGYESNVPYTEKKKKNWRPF